MAEGMMRLRAATGYQTERVVEPKTASVPATRRVRKHREPALLRIRWRNSGMTMTGTGRYSLSGLLRREWKAQGRRQKTRRKVPDTARRTVRRAMGEKPTVYQREDLPRVLSSARSHPAIRRRRPAAPAAGWRRRGFSALASICTRRRRLLRARRTALERRRETKAAARKRRDKRAARPSMRGTALQSILSPRNRVMAAVSPLWRSPPAGRAAAKLPRQTKAFSRERRRRTEARLHPSRL